MSVNALEGSRAGSPCWSSRAAFLLRAESFPSAGNGHGLCELSDCAPSFFWWLVGRSVQTLTREQANN